MEIYFKTHNVALIITLLAIELEKNRQKGLQNLFSYLKYEPNIQI